MTLSLEQYRTQLLNNILFASSQEEVIRCIDVSLKALEKKQEDGHIVIPFVDKISADLDLFNPMNKDAQQWRNIKIGRMHFYRIKKKLESEMV